MTSDNHSEEGPGVAQSSVTAQDLMHRGVALLQAADHAGAAECLARSIAIKPDFAEAHSNLGIALRALGRVNDSLQCYDRAIALAPGFLAAQLNKGVALHALGQHEQALVYFENVLASESENVSALFNMSLALLALGRLSKADESLERASQIAPNFAKAHEIRAGLLMSQQKHEAALPSLARAIELETDSVKRAGLLVSMGNALKDLRRLEQSAKCFEQALECNPSHEFLLGMVAYAKQTICDWQGLHELIERTRRGVEAQEKVVLPFVALCLADEPALQLNAAQIYWGASYPQIDGHPVPSQQFANAQGSSQPLSNKRGAKIRVAYYSADFYNHATSYLMAQLFELHDRDRFEVLGFSFGGKRDDEMARRVSRSFDVFMEVSNLSDREVAERSREMGVDIAIDLKGYTKGARPGMFAQRLAPVQVNYLGYPGTMGTRHFDYILADEQVLPQAVWHLMAEKVACLPDSYQVNDAKREISRINFARTELGLPESGFVFCCFNNSYKISQTVFDDWCEMMRRVPGSVLWLLKDSEAAANNLIQQAALRGIAPERLVFAKRMNLPEHLARHKAADLFLDTLPVNAHTTASDALWAGLPLLTREGQSFAGRVAASLLQALGLSELVTQDRQAYIDKAVALATEPDTLHALRTQLETCRLSAPLFDTQRFARNMEDALCQMHERAAAGLEPDHIWVREQN